MAQEERTQEEILAGWNTPPVDSGYDLMVGVKPPEGDGRATAAYDPNAGGQSTGPQEDYSDMLKADLQAEIDRRNEGRDEADLIEPEGTKKDDLVAALEADDEEYGDVQDPHADE